MLDPKAFCRDRKLPYSKLIATILSLTAGGKASGVQTKIEELFRVSARNGLWDDCNGLHRSAFTKARAKISWTASNDSLLKWLDFCTVTNIRPFPATAAVAANTYLIGDRKFKELLFKNGLPWVLVFDGLPGKNKVANPEDGTVMVIGDIGPVFGVDYALFRNVRGQKEIDSEDVLRKELSALKVDDPRRAALIAAINKYEPIHGRMLLTGAKKFNLFDFYGNPVAPERLPNSVDDCEKEYCRGWKS